MQVRDLIEFLQAIHPDRAVQVVFHSDKPDGEAHRHASQELPELRSDDQGKAVLVFSE